MIPRIFILLLSLTILTLPAIAAGPKVSEPGNKHNLSSSNTTVNYRAQDNPLDDRSRQVCVFCHTPHGSTSQGPLWNRRDTTRTFGRYSSSSLVIRRSTTTAAKYGEPNGSSRLCLSCHDGVNALGDLVSGPANRVRMVGNQDFITGVAQFTQDKVKKGHHPVSFVYDANVVAAISAAKTQVGWHVPPTLAEVKLDRQNRMQCNSCHDPHQNQSIDTIFYPSPDTDRKIVPFWAYHKSTNTAIQDHDDVCNSCHPNGDPYYSTTITNPWPR